LLIGVAALVGLALMGATDHGWIDAIPGVAAYAAAAIAGVAFPWLQAPSVEGRRIMDQIEGFREYLGVAEEGRLNALSPPDKTPELFERFLPYAVALDVENAWATRFAAVLAAAGTAATAAATSWYVGNNDWSRDPVGFADHLGSDLNHTIAAASTAPGSSGGGSDSGGSSGGGSSGGGGGGGGGSGW
jgi:uncharacterized membrane protein